MCRVVVGEGDGRCFGIIGHHLRDPPRGWRPGGAACGLGNMVVTHLEPVSAILHPHTREPPPLPGSPGCGGAPVFATPRPSRAEPAPEKSTRMLCTAISRSGGPDVRTRSRNRNLRELGERLFRFCRYRGHALPRMAPFRTGVHDVGSGLPRPNCGSQLGDSTPTGQGGSLGPGVLDLPGDQALEAAAAAVGHDLARDVAAAVGAVVRQALTAAVDVDRRRRRLVEGAR